MLPWAEFAAATASARITCRCHGMLTALPRTRFVNINSPQSSDRHSSIPAAAPCLKRRARSAHTADGCLASTRSTGLRSVHACRCHGSRSARAPPLRCHGVALWRRSAQPTHSAPVSGADAAEAWSTRAKGGRASAEIPVSQHCEGPNRRGGCPLTGRLRPRACGSPCRCRGLAC